MSIDIIDAINSFSNLHDKGLIKKGQFEAKVVDIVESSVSNSISLNTLENHLLSFKKMLDDDRIDEKIYDKISDLLLARCEISEKYQESLTKKNETPGIAKIDNSTDELLNVDEAALRSKEIKSLQQEAQAYYEKGLNLIKNYRTDDGVKSIAIAADLNHRQAKKYLIDNQQLVEAKKYIKYSKLGVKANNSKQIRKKREIGETESYLKSKKIEKPLGTHRYYKEDVPSKGQNSEKAPQLKKSQGTQVALTLFLGPWGLFYSSVKMALGFIVIGGLIFAAVGSFDNQAIVWAFLLWPISIIMGVAAVSNHNQAIEKKEKEKPAPDTFTPEEEAAHDSKLRELLTDIQR